MTPEDAAKLRAPFPASAVGKLPRTTCRACSKSESKVCEKHSKTKCTVCEAYTTTAHIHLDYVGHAGATDRLLQVDPEWTWEPVAFGEDGAPLVVRDRNDAKLWIRLTVAGVTRLGVGIVEAGSFELEKQLVSDAIRNAAMRFGVALDLWSKEDLLASVDLDTGEITDRAGGAATREGVGADAGVADPPVRSTSSTRLATDKQRKFIERLVDKTGMVPQTWPLAEDLSAAEASKLIDWLNEQPVEPPAERVATLRKQFNAEFAEGEEPF